MIHIESKKEPSEPNEQNIRALAGLTALVFSQKRSIKTVLLDNSVKNTNKTSNIYINGKDRNCCISKNVFY